MESFDQFAKMAWEFIQDVCVIQSFLALIWLLLPKYWKEKLKIYICHFKKVAFNEKSKLGEMLLNDIKLITGVDRDCNIIFKIDKSPLNIPNDLLLISKRLENENNDRAAKGEPPVYTDLEPYAVHKIVITREKEGNEKPECTVHIKKSSFFHSLITISALDEVVGNTTVRKKYYSELIENPYVASPGGKDLVHAFGLNTMVLTKDGSFVFAIRNINTVSTAGGCIHMSVGEHLNDDVLDYSSDGQPSATKSIVKGIHQELGIDISEEDKANIHFYAVGFAKSVCQYGVLGFVHLSDVTNMELYDKWKLSKDGCYESKEIIFIDAKIKSIVKYLNDNPNASMTKFALLNACLALMMEPELGNISQTKIEKELGNLRQGALV
jgi:hypothetical protein